MGEVCLEEAFIGIFPDNGSEWLSPPKDQEIQRHKETVNIEMGSNPDWPHTIFHLG